MYCNWEKCEPPLLQSMADGAALIGPGSHPELTAVQQNSVLNRRLDHTIQIAWRDTFLIDGSKPNKSLLSVTAAHPGYAHDWRGRITAYGTVGTGKDRYNFRDLDMNDFRHITDYFLSCGYEPPPTSPEQPPTVKGVMINCVGDQMMFNKPQFEAVDVSHSDPIFTNGAISDVADRIGLPILTRRCPANLEWPRSLKEGLIKYSPALNDAATWLFMNLDPASVFDPTLDIFGWGFVRTSLQQGARSVLVVRQDKKPLWVLHAEALSKYCQFEIPPLTSRVLVMRDPDNPNNKASKQSVMATICRDTFSTHWYKLLDEKTDEEKEGVPSPYDSDL